MDHSYGYDVGLTRKFLYGLHELNLVTDIEEGQELVKKEETRVTHVTFTITRQLR